MHQQMDFRTPNIEYLPGGWDKASRLKYARTADARATARNGTVLWTMRTNRRYVTALNTMSFHMEEAVWLAATRDQMGIGLEKMFDHQTTIGQTCTCKHRPPIDHHTDQHFHGCHYGHAFRYMAHTKIQGVLRGLARDAGMINQNTNITAPTSTNAKYMGVAI
jgi:hypothetical protein